MIHSHSVSCLICEEIEVLDQYLGIITQIDDIPDDIKGFKKFSLGSKQQPCTFDVICHAHRDDPAFASLRPQLNHFLTNFLQRGATLKGSDQARLTVL